MDKEQHQFLEKLEQEINSNHIANAYLIELNNYDNNSNTTYAA